MSKYFSKILILFLVLTAAAGCTPEGNKSQKTEDYPVISSISIEPQLGYKAETVLVEPNFKITVEVSPAERVDFFIADAEDEELGQSIWIDENGSDGWTADYTLPLPNKEFKITVRANYQNKSAEKSIIVLTEEKDEVNSDLINETAIRLTETGEKIARLKEVTGLPKYFLSQAWVDKSRFFGQTGTTPLIVNSNNFSYKTLRVNSWQGYPSPDGKSLAYLNEQGINIISLDGSYKRRFQPQDNSSLAGTLAGGVWSPDSSKLLFWLEEEWDSNYLIYDLKTSSIKKVETKLGGYYLTSLVGWVDNNRILFNTRAWLSKDGERESWSGLRSDLALASLRNNSYTLITSAQDGVFMKGVQILDQNTAVCQINNEGDNPSSYLFVSLDGNNHQLIPVKNATRLHVSPSTKQLAYLTNHGKSRGNQTANLVIQNQSGKIRLAKISYETISGPFWSPNEKWLLISLTHNKPAEEGKKGYKKEYKTYLLQVG